MSKAFIIFENVTVSYGEHIALDNITFEIQKGDFLGIIGGNGSGKTTLLKSILGLVQPSKGSIRIAGQPPGKSPVTIGYVSQYATGERNFPVTVEEIVRSGLTHNGLKAFRHYSSKNKTLVDAQLSALGLEDLRHRPVSQLSGGEFQRMLIGRALIRKPELLILDEPTANVDQGAQKTIYRLLGQLKGKMTIILVTHDLRTALSSVSSLACVHRELIYYGQPVLSHDIVQKIFHFDVLQEMFSSPTLNKDMQNV